MIKPVVKSLINQSVGSYFASSVVVYDKVVDFTYSNAPSGIHIALKEAMHMRAIPSCLSGYELAETIAQSDKPARAWFNLVGAQVETIIKHYVK